MDTLLIKNMIESDVHVDIYGDMYGHDWVAERIGAYIANLKARIAELENEIEGLHQDAAGENI